jgi:Monooxygenase af470-like
MNQANGRLGAPDRRTIRLSDFPDLVVIYLGMRVNALTGLKTLLGYGPKIDRSVAERPDGLLLHESVVYSLFPPHVGMRQYWRDFGSLERWARSDPHRLWWQSYLKSSGGTGFWHEAYFLRGGMEAVYVDMPVDVGFLKFAPQAPARGAMFSARERARVAGKPVGVVPLAEAELYGTDTSGSGSA